MIIADTSGLLALFNRREPFHARVAQVVAEQQQTLVVSPYVVAELDYLVANRIGVEAELAVLLELRTGAYELANLDPDDLQRCAEVIEQYRNLNIGLADASIVVLADRFATDRVLTLDRRHFTAMRPLRPLGAKRRAHFTLIPR